MGFVALAHISAEDVEQGDDSAIRLDKVAGEEEQKKKLLVSRTCDKATRRYVAAVARCVLALAERPFQVDVNPKQKPLIAVSIAPETKHPCSDIRKKDALIMVVRYVRLLAHHARTYTTIP